MSIDQFNDHLDTLGGAWVKLDNVGDTLKGELVSIEIRDKTFEGKPVLNSKTQKQRQEAVLTVKVSPKDGDDDGLRKFAANESAMRALKEAKPAEGFRLGGQIAIQVSKARPNDRSQHEYVAQYRSPAAAVLAGGDLL